MCQQYYSEQSFKADLITRNLVPITLLRFIIYECIFIYSYIYTYISYNMECIINPFLRLSYTHAFYSKHDLCPRFKQESCLTVSQNLFSQFSKLNKLLNEPWIKEEITEEIMKYFELNNSENNISKFKGCS